MNLQEVADHEEHTKIKHALQCSTEGCNAKISFVSGSGRKSDHFRTVRHSEHSDTCHLLLEEEKARQHTNYNQTVEASLDDKNIYSRIMYQYQKDNKQKSSTPKSSSRGKKKSSPSSSSAGVNVVLGGKDAPSVEKIRENGQKANIQIPIRQLNQITPSEAGKIFRLSAPIKKVVKTNSGYELSLVFGKRRAKLIITEAFLKGSEDIQVENYLNSLAAFLKDNNPYEVTVYVFCMFNQYNGNETIIYANDFSKFFVSVSGTQSKPRKLDSFQALYTRRVWS